MVTLRIFLDFFGSEGNLLDLDISIIYAEQIRETRFPLLPKKRCQFDHLALSYWLLIAASAMRM